MNEIELNNSELDRDRWMNNQREKEKEVKFFFEKKSFVQFWTSTSLKLLKM